MSVRERKREAKQKKSVKAKPEKPIERAASEASLPPFEAKIETISDDVESTGEIAHPSISVLKTEPKIPQPQWGGPEESEWMYQIPVRDEDVKMWTEEWADYLLDWAEATSTHVISIAIFIKEKPFRYLLNKTKAFNHIADALVAKDIAEWVDKKRKQLRVYWRPLEDWVDIIYEWAMATGNVRIDVKSLVIQESHRDFASLPERDLHMIMKMLVDRGLAEWVDKKRGAIVISV